MKLRILTVALTCALALIVSAASYAQYETSNRTRVGVRMVAYRPTGSQLKSMGSTWLTPMLDVNLLYDKQDRPTAFISMGWFGGEDNSSRTKASMIPVTTTYLKYFGKNPDKSLYVGGGLGLYSTKYETPWSSNSNRKIDFNLAAGLSFGNGWFSELRYDHARVTPTDYSGDVDFSGLSICVGSHLGF